jgi:uncharacterized protein DUF4178
VDVFLVLLVIVLIAVVVFLVLRGRAASKRSAPQDRPEPKDPLADHQGVTDVRTVRAGDMVEYGDTLYFVRGSLRLTQGGSTWSEHFLDDARGTRRWISVEEDPDLEIVMWRETDLVAEPEGKTVMIEGVTYKKVEDGKAKYRSEGTTTVAEQGRVEYYDYEGPDGKCLSFERFDDDEKWEVGLGETLSEIALRVYPAGSDRT